MEVLTVPDPILQRMTEQHAELNVQLLRAQYAELVAEALYQAKKLSTHARLADAPLHDNVNQYRTIAEAVVQMVCDESVLLAADYYAADSICGVQQIDLESLPLAKRVNLVRDWRVGLHAWLRILRGMYPGGLAKYRALAEDDRKQMLAQREASDIAAKRRRDVMRAIGGE